MLIIHILVGVFFGYILWKLLKATIKFAFWLLLIGIIVAIVFPKGLFLVGGIGFLGLSALGVLFVLSIIGFLFFEDN
ncbi:hypothetical protein [Ectobacillus sp. sgz5001026]|uniref:hypothetical protein n=1 Tax=Ectobacillus sp. sgz5001026 TaxID=3242473 RepID=UPI0036D2B3DA